MYRYFINTETQQPRQVDNYVPSVLNECLTATKQVGTEIIDGKEVPKLEPLWKEITEQEYLELTKPKEINIKPSYEDLVISKIRNKYSLDEELAILRQRDSKPEEFADYNDYCEACKESARKEIS